MNELHSITRRIDIDLDPVATAGDTGVVWMHEGFALAGVGSAATITLGSAAPPEVEATPLAHIHSASDLDRTATGAIAFGALSFARDADRLAGSLVVPEVVYGRDRDGNRWLTWTGVGEPPDTHELIDRLTAAGAGAAPAVPTRYEVTTTRPPTAWCASVAAARDALRGGAARKVVLARDIRIECDAPIARAGVLRRLVRNYASCYVFAMPTLIGASPELLVARRGDFVRSQPMAGTTGRSPDPAADARFAASLLASQKDRVEHQITIDMVHDTLLAWCSYLDAETEPQVVSIANLHHLATTVEGRLSHPLPSVLELVAALHPTPAVGGDPHLAALALIAEHEGFDRGSYAAPVGWIDHRGNGEFAVGVRSAEITGSSARLFAGVGVVADSDPQAELEETRVKLEAMLGSIVRP